mmetsp:Transcript_14583/g.42032  ORF Transcript_14583/g.42032 Transcript_14583/m.42032 type:complete len:89 (-) Transcript_14583:737-1003(-)
MTDIRKRQTEGKRKDHKCEYERESVCRKRQIASEKARAKQEARRKSWAVAPSTNTTQKRAREERCSLLIVHQPSCEIHVCHFLVTADK